MNLAGSSGANQRLREQKPGDGDDLGAAPPTAPREYVIALYNSYAETFDSHLQEGLAYRTPAIVIETLCSLFPGRR